MAQEGNDPNIPAPGHDEAPEPASTPIAKAPTGNGKPKKRGRPALAPSPMPVPPTPAETAGSRSPSATTTDQPIAKESPKEVHKRLLAQSKPLLNRKFPQLCQHDWLQREIAMIFQTHSLGTASNFTTASIGKRFAKWADNITGPFQPSLAEMLAYFATHEVLAHVHIDKFRCVTSEEHIVEKINALLADPNLAPEHTIRLCWRDLPFNIVNGDANVDLSSREPPLHPLSTANDHLGPFQGQAEFPGALHMLKREVPMEHATFEGIPPAKRLRTAEEDARGLMDVFQEEARSAICVEFENLKESLNEANAKAGSDGIKALNEGMETLAKDIPSKLDSSLEIFAHNLKQELNVEVQEWVKAGIRTALDNRESSIDEQLASRFSKLEDTLREEFRNIPYQEGQSQGYPVYCMPSVQLQMPQIGNMGHMGQQMLQGPALGGYIAQTPPPRNMKVNRDGQQQGNMQGRRGP